MPLWAWRAQEGEQESPPSSAIRHFPQELCLATCGQQGAAGAGRRVEQHLGIVWAPAVAPLGSESSRRGAGIAAGWSNSTLSSRVALCDVRSAGGCRGRATSCARLGHRPGASGCPSGFGELTKGSRNRRWLVPFDTFVICDVRSAGVSWGCRGQGDELRNSWASSRR